MEKVRLVLVLAVFVVMGLAVSAYMHHKQQEEQDGVPTDPAPLTTNAEGISPAAQMVTISNTHAEASTAMHLNAAPGVAKTRQTLSNAEKTVQATRQAAGSDAP